ncbi:hypothetical protein AJ80_10080 [Polytolypa hystricis UAMH7299]|uniref:C3HC-type domain-containing protein n=1 Tax=Polytolypa hystricis (strain UAMH7299) TaxID=1447883 RepID=A0A2B7WEC4_POLH7|nr:hypothetical protein AJ80_10080 [Polytolypa hystricis UAMH7299]
MSYSVTTKKRKFHRVLDSISNVSAQKPATSTADPSALSKSSSNVVAPSTPNSTTAMTTGNIMYPTIKKVRLTPGSEVDNAIVKLSKATGGSLARRHAAAASSPSSIRSSSTSRPNFVPWDRERFLERLETFRRVDRWSPKPARINEVQWAKRGWSCVDVMRVECVGGCGQAVVVKLPGDIEEGEDGYDSDKREERSEVQTKLVEKYAELIIDGHSEKCPWRKTGCDGKQQSPFCGVRSPAKLTINQIQSNAYPLQPPRQP